MARCRSRRCLDRSPRSAADSPSAAITPCFRGNVRPAGRDPDHSIREYASFGTHNHPSGWTVCCISTPMVEIENLHVSIEDKEILKGVDLTVNQGEIHAL